MSQTYLALPIGLVWNSLQIKAKRCRQKITENIKAMAMKRNGYIIRVKLSPLPGSAS